MTGSRTCGLYAVGFYSALHFRSLLVWSLYWSLRPLASHFIPGFWHSLLRVCGLLRVIWILRWSFLNVRNCPIEILVRSWIHRTLRGVAEGAESWCQELSPDDGETAPSSAPSLLPSWICSSRNTELGVNQAPWSMECQPLEEGAELRTKGEITSYSRNPELEEAMWHLSKHLTVN